MREARRRDGGRAIHESPLQHSGESPEQDPSLPMGWLWAGLGDICDTVSGGTPNRKNSSYYGGTIAWLKSGELKDGVVYESEETITEEGLRHSSARVIPRGTLLIALYGATAGRLGILGLDAATNQAICAVLCPAGVERRFVYWQLLSVRYNLLHARRGGAQPNLSQQILRNTRMVLPPLPEQRRIVAKIEELFSQLDAGVEALQKVKTQLQRYRQAVLKHAFEGRLTAEWREAHRDELEPASVFLERIEAEQEVGASGVGASHELPLQKGRRRPRKKLPPLDTSELPELPEGWVWTRIGDIGQVNPGLPSDQYSDDMVVSFVPMRAVQEETGEVDLSMQRPYCEVRRGYTPFVDGDVLFAKITPCMENGKAAVVRNLENGIGFGSTEFHVVRLAPASMVPQLLFFFLTGEVFRKEAQRHMTGSAGQLRVPTNYIRTALVPLATQREQLQMVDQIEVRLTCSRAIENTVDTTLQRVERLRQAILKRAFEGRLVAQDPSDEPAWKLLERIKAQKGRQGSTKKAGGRGRRERSPEATQGRLL